MKKTIMNNKIPSDAFNSTQAISEKLLDALTPGLEVEFDPDEAMRVGACIEDALAEMDAKDSCFDEIELEKTDTGFSSFVERSQ